MCVGVRSRAWRDGQVVSLTAMNVDVVRFFFSSLVIVAVNVLTDKSREWHAWFPKAEGQTPQ